MADISNAPWDGSASRFTPEQWRASCLIDTGEGDPDSKSRYKLPVKEPGGALSRAGVHAAAGRIHGTEASPAQKKAAAKKLMGYYSQLKEDAPPDLKVLAA